MSTPTLARSTGGSATVRGVLYQLLSAAERAARVTITPLAGASDSPPRFLLVLEPSGGGGDWQLVAATASEMVQAKSGRRPRVWSVSDFAKHVLPDLVLGAASPRGSTTAGYVVVTEAEVPWWSTLASGSQSPAAMSIGHPDGDAVVEAMHLDLGPRCRGSLASLFDRISRSVHASRHQLRKMPQRTVDELTWRVLQRLDVRIVQEQELREGLAEHLLEFLPADRDVEETIKTLLGELLELSSRSGTTLSGRELFRRVGLDWRPVSTVVGDRARILRAASTAAEDILGYEPDQDVRAPIASPGVGENLLIEGDSGVGKSWALGALAAHAAQVDDTVVVVVSARATERDTWEAASAALGAILERDRPAAPDFETRSWARRGHCWRTLVCVDDVRSPELLEQLLSHTSDLPQLSLVMSAPSSVVRAANMTPRSTLRTHTVGRFSTAEARKCLESHGVDWSSLTEEVRELVRWPLASSLYTSLRARPEAAPATEPQLLDAYWTMLGLEHSGLLARLAAVSAKAVTAGYSYPFAVGALVDGGLLATEHQTLVELGLLRSPEGGTSAFWHDRFLSWAVATDFRRQSTAHATSDTWLDALPALLEPTKLFNMNPVLLHAPLDLAWMGLRGRRPRPDLVARLLPVLEDPRFYRNIYDQWLPALGPAVFGVLEALATRLDTDNPWAAIRVGETLARVTDTNVCSAVPDWLASNCEPQRLAIMAFLTKVPSGEARVLDALWALPESTSTSPHWLADYDGYRWRALRAGTALNADWISRKLPAMQADRAASAQLADLFASLPVGEATRLWPTLADRFLDALGPDASEGARLIARTGDRARVGYLAACLASHERRTIYEALVAFIDIDPDAAVAALRSRNDEPFRRSWWPHMLTSLARRRPMHVSEALALHCAVDEPDAIEWLLLLADDPHLITAPLLELALAHVTSCVDALLKSGDLHHGPLNRLLSLLLSVWREDLVATFRGASNTPVEEALRTLLIRAASHHWSSFDERQILLVLARLSKEALASGIADLLRSDSRDGRLAALPWALVIQTAEIESALVTASAIPLPQDRDVGHVVRSRTLDALCAYGRLDAVVRSALADPHGLDLSLEHLVRSAGPLDADTESTLTAALKEEPAWRRGNAAVILGWAGSAKAAALLRAACDDLEWQPGVARGALAAQGRPGVDRADALAFLARALEQADWSRLAGWHLISDFGEDGAGVLGGFLRRDPRVGTETCLQLALWLHDDGYNGAAELVALFARRDHGARWTHSRWIEAAASLDEPWITEEIHRLAFESHSSSGARSSALRALAARAPELAFSEARRVFEDEENERSAMAATLITIDAARALPLLLAQAVREPKDTHIIARAIAHAVRDDAFPLIEALLASSRQADRLAGARLAGALRYAALEGALTRVADADESESVRRHAVRALSRLRDQALAQRLLELAASGTDAEAASALASLLVVADCDLGLLEEHVGRFRHSARGQAARWQRFCSAMKKDGDRAKKDQDR